MFSNRKWQRFALFLNLLGTVLLFASFQATSSDFRLVTTKDHRYALCVDKSALIVKGENGFGIGEQSCPEWDNARPAAVVNFERPWMVKTGLILTILGFLMQFLAIPGPKSLSQMREDIRVEKFRIRMK